VKSIFNEVGLGYIFQNQVGYFDRNMVKQILMNQFIQSNINNLSRGQFYSGFKKKNCLENYLLRLSEYNIKWITKFSDIDDFKELQKQTMKYRKEDTHNKKVKWMEIKCLRFLKTDPDKYSI
jgi:hypothetical protein